MYFVWDSPYKSDAAHIRYEPISPTWGICWDNLPSIFNSFMKSSLISPLEVIIIYSESSYYFSSLPFHSSSSGAFLWPPRTFVQNLMRAFLPRYSVYLYVCLSVTSPFRLFPPKSGIYLFHLCIPGKSLSFNNEHRAHARSLSSSRIC